MRKVVTAIVIAAMVLAVVAAACGGATNQTVTPGESPTSAAPLPSTSPTGGGTPAGTPTGTPTGGGGSAALGKAVYASNCASCHGATGTGGIGPDITAITDFTRVQQQVTKGGAQGPDPTPGTGGVVMPAFKGVLTPAQIDSVSKYVSGGFKG